MEFKQVKEVSPIEEKSTQEVEQNLLDKHEESLKVSDVNQNVSETSDTVEETIVEETKVDQDVTDLPEPDSPTIPIVSPLLSVNETSITALTDSSSVWNSVTKFLISNNVLLPILYKIILKGNKITLSKKLKQGIMLIPNRRLDYLRNSEDENTITAYKLII